MSLASLATFAFLAPQLIVLASAVAATVTGYGFVLLASPLLLMLLLPAEAVPLSIGLGWIVITILLSRRSVWRSIEWQHVLRLAAGGMLGIPVGTALLLSLDPRLLRVLLGLLIALLALANLTSLARASFEVLEVPDGVRDGGTGAPFTRDGGRFGMGGAASTWRTLASGFFAGILSGCAGLGGSLIVLYLSRRGMDKHRLRATSAATIWCTSSVTLVVFAVSGQVPATIGVTLLTLVPALLAGMLAGSRVFHALPERSFRLLSLSFAAAAGLITAGIGATAAAP